MKNPWVDIETDRVPWCTVPWHVKYSPKPHHIDRRCSFETQTLLLSPTTLHCKVVSVPPHTLRCPKLHSADEWLEGVHVASTIEVETMVGKTVLFPVFCTEAPNLKTKRCGSDEWGKELFVEISSMCSHDNVLLRDLDTGVLLVPQLRTFYCRSSHKGNVWRTQRKKIVVLQELRRRYQLVAVALKNESEGSS